MDIEGNMFSIVNREGKRKEFLYPYYLHIKYIDPAEVIVRANTQRVGRLKIYERFKTTKTLYFYNAEHDSHIS